jgi:hypothetical protein
MYLPPGELRVRWFRGSGSCPFRRPGQPAISDEKMRLDRGATLRARWPQATSNPIRR